MRGHLMNTVTRLLLFVRHAPIIYIKSVGAIRPITLLATSSRLLAKHGTPAHHGLIRIFGANITNYAHCVAALICTIIDTTSDPDKIRVAFLHAHICH